MLDELSIKELTALYNEKADKPIKKFDSKSKGIARIEKLMEEKKLRLGADDQWMEKHNPTKGRKTPVEKAKPAPEPKKKKSPAAKKTDKSKSRRFTPDMIITVLRVCPVKRGSKRNPYGVYETGMTVKEVLDSGVVTSRDLNWDTKEDRPGGAVIEINSPAK